MSIYQPRPYQTNCIAALAEARENGTKKGLVVMASGLGKTLTAIFDLQQFLQDCPNARILCLCHQESILLQSKAKFQKFFGEEYSYGMFTGTYKTSRIVTFLFATFQTMRDHRDEFASGTFDYVVVDEAHHTAAETYQPTADYFEPLFLLGLTATKDRMDGQDILETYEQVLYEMDIYDGWNEGWLARVDYRIMLDDLNEEEFEKYVGSHAISEKVSLSQLNKTIFAPQHDEGIVASIREQTADLDNPSIFVFCSGIEHANAMAGYFGGEAAVIHSGQSTAMNEAILDNFRSGDIRIIISVNMLNEGIDVPEANVVVFLRSTESSTIFFQQLGRGLRISGDSRIVRVLDYVANLERIAMILDMEETARKRIASSPRSSSSASKPNPIVVNIPATKFKVQRVDIDHLFINMRRRRQWTKEEVIAGLVAMDYNGQEISYTTIRQNPSLPYPSTIKLMFDGSINNALKEAHINQAVREYNYSEREEMITEGKNMISQGIRISYGSLRRNKEVSIHFIVKEFGSVSAFAVLCGQELIQKEEAREKTLSVYWEESVKAGHWLSQQEIERNNRLPTTNVFRHTFGRREDYINLAIEKYGPIPTKCIPDNQEEKKRQIRLALAQEFYEASLRKGSWLSCSDFTKKNSVSSLSTYRKYFHGGIKAIINFLRSNHKDIDAKLETKSRPLASTPKQITRHKTDRIMIEEYWVESNNAGHWLSNGEVDKRYPRLSSSSTYRYRFGNLEAVRCLAIEAHGNLKNTQE